MRRASIILSFTFYGFLISFKSGGLQIHLACLVTMFKEISCNKSAKAPAVKLTTEKREDEITSKPKEQHAAPTASFSVEELMNQLGVDDSYYILGIDEAGRGPVIGPMVYTGAVVRLSEHKALIECGVADSKQIDEVHRNTSLEAMKAKLESFSAFTHVITAETISSDMLGVRRRTLNTLSHDTAIQIILEATFALKGKLCAVFVDTVGPPEAYSAKLRGRFPHLHIEVKAKADSLFPIVSAASIVAKVTRDKSVQEINDSLLVKSQQKQLENPNAPVDSVGCGYPSDPKAMAYVRSNVHRFFLHTREESRFIRSSWAPVAELANRPDVCVPVLFEEDARRSCEANQIDRLKKFKYEETSVTAPPGGVLGQKKLSFRKPPPKPYRVFQSLHLKSSISKLCESQEEK